MNNATIRLKVEQRLNKLSSKDYDNIQPWQIIEAFNKGVSNWCRRNLHGTNLSKAGDESNKVRIDDLEPLLKEIPLVMYKKDLHYISGTLPADYFEWKRISATAKKDCCEGVKKMMIYLAEEANVDILLRDENKKPDYSWGETFVTRAGGKIKVWTNNDFNIADARLVYYKQPRKIEIAGVSDPYTGTVSLADVECEFKDDLVELFIDECVKIISGSISNINVNQIADNAVEQNN